MVSPVYTKKRVLIDAVSVTADGALPVWDPDGDPLVFIGDFKGAIIGGGTATIASLTGITAVDIKLQHADEPGGTWTDVGEAFAQLTANGTAVLDVTDDTFFKRHVRAYVDVTGTGTVIVTVALNYCQPKCRGTLAPPGRPAINH